MGIIEIGSTEMQHYQLVGEEKRECALSATALLSETIAVEDAKMISKSKGWSHDGQGR